MTDTKKAGSSPSDDKTAEVNAQKKHLRKEYLALRNAVLPSEKAVLDRILTGKIVSLPAFSEAGTVLLYASCGSEPDTSAIADTALRLGKAVAYPRTDPVSRRIRFFRVFARDELVEGFHKIPEPPVGAVEVFPDEHTFCLVPALSLDRDGFRLGYGGGYYDRFLGAYGHSRIPFLTVGAIYSRLLSEDPLPRDPYDLPVSLIVTEKGV